jgi:hydroxyacylglutathione hydrolase
MIMSITTSTATSSKMRVHRINAFDDNYFWIIENTAAPERVAVVDPGDAQPVVDWLVANKRELGVILLTHHHGDHVGGVAQLRTFTAERGQEVLVFGPKGDAAKIRFDFEQLVDDQALVVLGFEAQVLHVPGHTLGHIAYWFEANQAAFCGDTLFAMGCGRLFEGTPDQMWTSLQRLSALPDDTLMYCAHEYTASNCKFALAEEPSHASVQARVADVTSARAAGQATVPFAIGYDRQSNPFLRASKQDFAALRQRKDVFK